MHLVFRPASFPAMFPVLRRATTMLLVQLTLLLLPGAVTLGDWPMWRGPQGDGTSDDVRLPLRWDGPSGENIRWKTRLPGEGHSSPIVWKDSVFVTSCQPESKTRSLIRLDRHRGEILWQETVLTAGLESKHALNSYASSTPATDGERVFVSFLEPSDEQVVAPNVGSERLIYRGTMVVAAYDFQGNCDWVVRPGGFISAHGFCSNPVPYRDTIIVNGDHDGDSFIVALDKGTGKIRWKTKRRHQTRSYGTPIIREIGGQPQLVLCGSKCVAAFDPDSGKPIWHVEGPTEQFVASMVYDGTHFFAVGGYPTHHVIAIDPRGKGDVTDTHVAWHVTNVRSYVPSPVLVDQFLLIADDRGTANCFDVSTGDRLWQTRMGKHFSASLTAVNGLVYFMADDGVVSVVRPGMKPDVLVKNELGENIYSTPAVSDGELFLRGEKHLFCISDASR